VLERSMQANVVGSERAPQSSCPFSGRKILPGREQQHLAFHFAHGQQRRNEVAAFDRELREILDGSIGERRRKLLEAAGRAGTIGPPTLSNDSAGYAEDPGPGVAGEFAPSPPRDGEGFRDDVLGPVRPCGPRSGTRRGRSWRTAPRPSARRSPVPLVVPARHYLSREVRILTAPPDRVGSVGSWRACR
jgi:hypothetical protein